MATAKKIAKKPSKSVEKKTVDKKPYASQSRSLKGDGTPCICIKKTKYWYCMKQLADGSLMQCDGPFKTEAICKTHVCL